MTYTRAACTDARSTMISKAQKRAPGPTQSIDACTVRNPHPIASIHHWRCGLFLVGGPGIASQQQACPRVGAFSLILARLDRADRLISTFGCRRAAAKKSRSRRDKDGRKQLQSSKHVLHAHVLLLVFGLGDGSIGSVDSIRFDSDVVVCCPRIIHDACVDGSGGARQQGMRDR